MGRPVPCSVGVYKGGQALASNGNSNRLRAGRLESTKPQGFEWLASKAGSSHGTEGPAGGASTRLVTESITQMLAPKWEASNGGVGARPTVTEVEHATSTHKLGPVRPRYDEGINQLSRRSIVRACKLHFTEAKK